MQTSLPKIYVVDDDPGHTRLIVKNLRRSGIDNAIHVFHSGVEVLEKIHDTVEESVSLLLLLDLNMPGISGKRVLKGLKSDERTKLIPIIMLTTTDDLHEMKECYDLGCNLFITKPIQYDEFAGKIKKLGLAIQIIAAPPLLPSN